MPYAVAVLPVVSETGELLKPFLTVEAFLISEYKTVNKKGAKAFAEYLTSFEGAKVRAVEGRQAVATKSVYKDEALVSDNVLNVFRQQAEIAVPMSNSPKMRVIWEPMAGALRKVLRGAETPERALEAV